MATQSQDPNWQAAQKARLEEYKTQRKSGAFSKDKTEDQRKATMKIVKSKGSPMLTGDYTKGVTQVGGQDRSSQWSKRPEPESPATTPQQQQEVNLSSNTSQGDLTQNDLTQGENITGIERDYERETSALERNGLTPNDIMNMNPKKLFEMTYTEEELAGLEDYQKLLDYENAKNTMENTPAPTNTMLAGLEDALRGISDPARQPLGVSQLYKQAGIATEGVSGYTTLMQSLNNQSKVMDDNYNNFTKQLSTTGGAMADAYNAVKDKYELHKDEIERINKQYDAALQNAFQTEQAMKLLERENEIQRDAEAWASSQSPGFSDGITDGDQEELAGLFDLPGKSKYREDGGWECAEGHNRITDGAKIGSLWADKMQHVTKRDNPQVGNGLAIPLGVGTGNPYGHFETVIGIGGDQIYTQSWNRNEDGKQTFQSYSLDQLNKKYGDNWGFTDSKLKPEYEKSLTQFNLPQNEKIVNKDYDSSPKWFQKLMDEYVKGNYTEENIRGKIGRIQGLSDEEINGYKSLFDNVLDQPIPESVTTEAKLWKNIGNIFGAEKKTSTWKEMYKKTKDKATIEKEFIKSEDKKRMLEDKTFEMQRKSLLKLSEDEIKKELKIKYIKDKLSDKELEEKYQLLIKKYNL